ncbi:PAS domain-containing protein [Kiloniella sp. b19]|uniref:PAS domain-containing protein n=1 Tax=Kiloniella sp. GXU_MW_B19 TaxID=3141326 RepID=UPI0031DE7B66
MYRVENDVTTGVEQRFDQSEIIVSKTDLKGRITYANEVFIRISGYSEEELLGEPHRILRHPGMPRCVFKLLWDRIAEGHEIFAYVVNLCKNGDHYWVFAHVTPSLDSDGTITGYHSNRRLPDPAIVSSTIEPLYAQLMEVEKSHSNAKEGMHAGFAALEQILKDQGVSYDEFIFSL